MRRANYDGEEPELPPKNLTEVVTRGVSFAGAGFVLSQSLTLVAYLILARLATPEDFGEFAAAALVVNIGLLFTESGMLGAIIHRKDRVDEAASTATAATFLSGILFAVFALAVSPLIGLLFQSDQVGRLAAGMSGLLFLRSLQIVPEGLLQRRFSFVRRLVVEPSQAIAFGIAAVIATSNGLGPWGLVIGFYASAATDALLSWTLVRWRPRARQVSFAMWRELIAYGRHLVTGNIALRVTAEVPTVLIGRFIGAPELGQFRYTDRMASTPHALIINAGAFVAFPALARIADDPDRFLSAFHRIFRAAGVFAFLLGFLLVPFGISSSVLVFGDVWRAAGEAVMPLGVGVAVASVTSLMSEAFKALGHPQIILPSRTVAGVSGTIAMIALLPFGLVGVAAGLSFGYIVGGVYKTIRLGRLVEVSPWSFLEQLWPSALAATVMVAVMTPIDRLLVRPDTLETFVGLMALAAEVLTAIGIFLGILRLASPSTFAMGREAASRALKRRSANSTSSGSST